jgi:hypothetical protein
MLLGVFIVYFWTLIRLFSHGYSFFSPGEAVVYHLYSRAHRTTFQSAMSHVETELKKISLQVVLSLLLRSSLPNDDQTDKEKLMFNLNFTYYGFGKVHNVTEFFEEIGCDLNSLTVLEKDWLKCMIPKRYESNSLSVVEGLIINEDSTVRSFKNDILGALMSDSSTFDQNLAVVNPSNPLTSILQFLK